MQSRPFHDMYKYLLLLLPTNANILKWYMKGTYNIAESFGSVNFGFPIFGANDVIIRKLIFENSFCIQLLAEHSL